MSELESLSSQVFEKLMTKQCIIYTVYSQLFKSFKILYYAQIHFYYKKFGLIQMYIWSIVIKGLLSLSSTFLVKDNLCQ